MTSLLIAAAFLIQDKGATLRMPAGPPIPVKTIGIQLRNFKAAEVAPRDFDIFVVDPRTTKEDVSALHTGPRGKRAVLAALDVGAVEPGSMLWRSEWDRLNNRPLWIGTEEERAGGRVKSLSVQFWNPEWQRALFGDGTSALARILAAGFDGLYLRNLDGYERYEAQGRTSARQEMMQLLYGLGTRARVQKKGCILFVENPAELIKYDFVNQYFDGFAFEGMYFGRQREGIASPSDYIAETEKEMSERAQEGRIVVAIGYTQDPKQAAESANRARTKGFIPFVGTRALDRLP